MYRAHFNLKERPFTQAPGQRFHAPNAGVTDAVGRLEHLLQARDAIALMTGGPGVGKSTLAECALASARDRAAVVRVDLRYGEPEDLCSAILLGLGSDVAGLQPVQALHVLRQAMGHLVREDHRLILCLDVGGISVEVAKHLLRVVNLAGERDCQMNVLLMGPHPLHQQLDLPALIQLRQRIGFRYRARPLTLTETDRYIRHQLEAVGGDPTALISSSVAAAVYCYVAGVPRLINTLLDATLSEAALQKLQRPDGNLIKRVADSLGWKPMTPPQTATESSQRPAKKSSGTTAPPKLAASEMTLQLRNSDVNGRPPVSLASEAKSPTAAVFGPPEAPPPPPADSSLPLMSADDTSATGMLRLQDLDERFAETIFGKDAAAAKGK